MDMSQHERLGFLEHMEQVRKALHRRPPFGPGISALVDAHDHAMAEADATPYSVYLAVRGASISLDRVRQLAADRYAGTLYASPFGEDSGGPAPWRAYVQAAKREAAEERRLEKLEQRLQARFPAPEPAPQIVTGEQLAPDSGISMTESERVLSLRVGQLLESRWITQTQATAIAQSWGAWSEEPAQAWHAVHGVVQQHGLDPVAAKYLTSVVDEYAGAGRTLDWEACEQHATESPQFLVDHQEMSPQAVPRMQ